MTTWTIKTETDDLQSVREMVEDQQNRGYSAWIEDENGRSFDEEAFKKSGRSLYQIVMAVIIWGAAIAVTLGALYVASILSGDPLRAQGLKASAIAPAASPRWPRYVVPRVLCRH